MTGPIIQPIDAIAPQTGLELSRFLQPWLVGLSGLPGELVRLAFQYDPPNVPDTGVAWMAFRYSVRPADDLPYFGADPTGRAGTEAQILSRHETINTLCSFFDLGQGGLADALATLTRDNMAVPQNVERLTANNMGIAHIGQLQPVPVVVKNRWQYRVDFSFAVNRQILRTYPVPSVVTVSVKVAPDAGPAQVFTSS